MRFPRRHRARLNSLPPPALTPAPATAPDDTLGVVPTPDEPHRVAEADGFGGFQRGHLHLALPMAALREVVPLGALTPLPCPAPCVLGGLSLRGATVPVIDLLVALGGERSAPAALPIVVILVHAGRILGLLADAVTGVFQCAPGGLSRCGASDALAALLAGNILRQDGAGTVSVLSPAALVQLHQLPLVDDPEPERAHLDHGDVGGAVNTAVQGDAAMPVVLLRCGQLPLAIDAMAVYATVAHQQILPSVLARGHCKGVIDFAGSHIPALDLQAVCGFGPSDPDDLAQAIVLRLEAGMVAMLVGEVIDVVRCAPGDVITVPAFALPQAALIAGALPTASLPAELLARLGASTPQFLLLQGDALKACAEVQGLSQTNTPGAGLAVANTSGRSISAGPQGSMLTYALNGETATPLDQVSEILSYPPEAARFGSLGPMLGLVVNRGRSIPVLCLAQVSGSAQAPAEPPGHVLVVEAGGSPVGFAVATVRSIELADWPAFNDIDSDTDATTATGPLNTRRLARVGAGNAERLLPVLDLRRLALQLQARPHAA